MTRSISKEIKFHSNEVNHLNHILVIQVFGDNMIIFI